MDVKKNEKQLKYLKTDKGKTANKEAFKRWYDKNKLAIKEKKQKEYLLKKDFILQKCKNYQSNNKEKVALRNKKYRQFITTNLTDRYIKTNLVNNGFTKESITQELIEVKRIILKTKRL